MGPRVALQRSGNLSGIFKTTLEEMLGDAYLLQCFTGKSLFITSTTVNRTVKTYFLIVFHSYHVTYYYLYCLLFNVVC